MFAFYQTLFTLTASLTRTSVDGGQVWSPWFHHGIMFLPLFVTNNLFLPKHSSSKSICSCLEHSTPHLRLICVGMYRNKNYMLHAKAFLTSLSTRVWNIITYTCTVKVARCEGLIGLKKIWSSSAHFLTQTSNTCPENLYQTMHHLYRTGFHSFASFYEAERSATVSCSKRKLSYQNSNPPDSS